MTKEVRDFLLSVTPNDPSPLLGGFLPSPLERLLRKRCRDYKKEIEVLRDEIVAIASRAVWYKISLEKEVATILSSSLPLDLKNQKMDIGDVKKSSSNYEQELLDVSKAAAQMELSDKDAVHCDRLKRFKAA